jgi:hypothetical protein
LMADGTGQPEEVFLGEAGLRGGLRGLAGHRESEVPDT